MSVSMSYDAGMRPSTKTWTLGDGSMVDDVDSVSTGGRVLSTRFDGVDTTYGYDGFGRLVAATTGTVGAAYGWDRDHDLVCTARGLTASVTSCADAPNHVTNEYSGGRLASTTDPEWALPATAYDAVGNMTGAGDRAFRYDARQQLSGIERAGVTATFERDSSGRVVAQHDEAGTTRLFYAAPDDPTPVAVVSADGGVAFSAPLPGGVVWSTNELIITDHSGNPAIHLTPAGVRQPGRPTQRYGPFGEDLTPASETVAPDPSTTPTSVAPAATSSTTTTSTTVPSTSTTISTPADASSADPAGETTTSTTSAGPTPTTEPTTTSSTTTTTTTTSTTTTSTTTTVAPQASEFEPRSWAGRIALDDGVMNLGQRAMLPALGVFTGPDPIPGGSCTVYGYTCADPVNTDDLSGTFSTGAGIAMGIGLLFALIVPGAQMFGGLAAGLFVESLASMALGSLGSFLGVLAETWADKGFHAMFHIAWADLGQAALTGLTLGAATAAVGAGLTVLTKFEGPLAEAALNDYAYGAKLVRSGFAGVDEDGLYASADVYRTFRTMGGLRRVAVRYVQTRSTSPGFLVWVRTPAVRNAIGIFFVKQGAGAGARYGVHEAHLRWGIFD
jgi:YD repeat-containing protein